MISNTHSSTRSSSKVSRPHEIAVSVLVGTLLLITSSVSHVGYYLSPFGYRVAATVLLLSAIQIVLAGLPRLRGFLHGDAVFGILVLWSLLIVVRGVPPDEIINSRFITWAPLPLLYLALGSLSTADLKRIVVPLLLLIPAFSFHLGQNVNEFSFMYLGWLTLFGLWCEPALPLVIAGFGAFAGLYLTCRSAILASLGAIAYLFRPSPKAIVVGLLAGAGLIFAAERHAAEPFHFRDVLVKLALESFRESPIIGAGHGKYRKILEGPRAGMEFEHAHCFPITVLSDTGILGFGVLILFVIAVARRWKDLPLASRLVIIEYAVWSFFDEPLQWLSGWSVLIAALTRTRESEPK